MFDGGEKLGRHLTLVLNPLLQPFAHFLGFVAAQPSDRGFDLCDGAHARKMHGGMAVGFGFNAVRPHPLPLRYEKPATKRAVTAEAPATEPLGMSLQELRDAPKESVVIIDARTPLFFKLGHIAGAMNVSRKDFARDFTRVEGTLRKGMARRLVVYCSDQDCDDALLVARDLIRAGLKGIHVFKGGWKEWQEAGLPEEQG